MKHFGGTKTLAKTSYFWGVLESMSKKIMLVKVIGQYIGVMHEYNFFSLQILGSCYVVVNSGRINCDIKSYRRPPSSISQSLGKAWDPTFHIIRLALVTIHSSEKRVFILAEMA